MAATTWSRSVIVSACPPSGIEADFIGRLSTWWGLEHEPSASSEEELVSEGSFSLRKSSSSSSSDKYVSVNIRPELVSTLILVDFVARVECSVHRTLKVCEKKVLLH